MLLYSPAADWKIIAALTGESVENDAHLMGPVQHQQLLLQTLHRFLHNHVLTVSFPQISPENDRRKSQLIH